MTSPWTTDGGIHRIPLPIHTGSLWLCGKHYIAPQVEKVCETIGDGLVVCLTQKHELEGRYDDYVTWLETHRGDRAWWHPIYDLNAPPLDEARVLLENITEQLRNDRNIVVHCAAGIGRAGTTAVGTLMMLGMTAQKSIAHVRAHRPMAGPEAGAQHDLIWALSGVLPDQRDHH
jgi:protein-tyrosine phosphatase